ncbi:pentapeptide repeat-containing protein [Algicella marina]|nr:pentapeptide repeat-containing protein [Algicella marina]
MHRNWPFQRFIRDGLSEPEQYFVWLMCAAFAVALGVATMLALAAWVVGIGLLLVESYNAVTMTGVERYSENRNAMLILAAVVGAPLVAWRAYLAGRDVQIKQEGHYTELFTKAVEQLGATKAKFEDVERVILDSHGAERRIIQREQTTERNIEVRLGAIYALERVMKDSARDAGPIVETLSAYVRENCGEPVVLDEADRPMWEKEMTRNDYTRMWRSYLNAKLPEKAPGSRADIQAALAVLGRRMDGPKPADFDTGDPGILLPAANLQGAGLAGARLEGADLGRARLEGADLGEAQLKGANLRWARLQGANLRGARLESADIGVAWLEATDLSRAQLDGANLAWAGLQGAELFDARLKGANLGDARLAGADLRYAGLEGVNLSGARLVGADFGGARLKGADFRRTILKGARLRTDFTILAHLPQDFEEQVAQAFGHKVHTKLPEGVAVPEHWFEGDDWDAEEAAWKAFKASLGL